MWEIRLVHKDVLLKLILQKNVCIFVINSSRKLKTNEPYVLASQAHQVYYVKDTKDPNWLVVTKSQDLYDMP